MGKPYAQELESLSMVYDWSSKTSIDELSGFLKKSAKLPLYAIGSGGSFSATTFISLLHQHSGTISRCFTPFEFLEFNNIDRNCSILIITAGGNNKDILSAFEKAVRLNPKVLGILCASVDNKLTQKASETPNVFTHAVELPTGKDGFLATNSLIATLIWIARAYIESFSLPYVIPKFSRLNTMIQTEFEKFQNKQTVVLLYDNWGKIAAIDAESKLVEAGLVNVQMADYRNFAHGRHNWLDKNKEKTGLLALITPHCELLATKTLKLIPDYIPITSLSTNFDGPIASIALLIQVLYLVQFFGTARKIDPGRPGVANFGSKIYHLPIPKSFPENLTDLAKLALRRKFDNANTTGIGSKSRIKSFHKFIDNISRQRFGAIIFDYDGTLCDYEHRFSQPSQEIGSLLSNLLKNDIVIGIATGRGKSVRESIRNIIPKYLWPKLFIGYYNCADITTLNDDEAPAVGRSTEKNLEIFFEFIQKQRIFSGDAKITKRPDQITLEDSGLSVVDLIKKIEAIDRSKLAKVRIVESSHSIDILSKTTSKLRLVKYIQNLLLDKYAILCVGDRGIWPGNDFELLSTPFSLSVDETSNDPNTCWNFLPCDINGEFGVLHYFKEVSYVKNYCIVHVRVD